MIGRCVINMTEAGRDLQVSKPKWYELDMGAAGTQEGQILLSFNLAPKGQQLILPPHGIRPETIPVQIEINCLGLRDLQPTGLLPVRKAFIKFDLNSLKADTGQQEGKTPEQADEEAKQSRNITTQPKESGNNPNINAVMTVDAHLSKDPVYWSWLSCTVYDSLWLSNPTLGVFSIPLNEVLIPSIKEAQKEAAMEKKQPPKSEPKIEVEGAQQRLPKQEEEQKKEEVPAKEETKTEQSPAKEEEKNQQGTKIPIQMTEKSTQQFMSGILQKKIQQGEPAQKIEKIKLQSPGIQKGRIIKYPGPLTYKQMCEGHCLKLATYEKDEQTAKQCETNIPDPDYYEELGYDRTEGEGTKHYRYKLKCELEKSGYIDITPFDQYILKRGQNRGTSGLSGLFGGKSKNTIKNVGKFKGILKLSDKSMVDLGIEFPKHYEEEKQLHQEIQKKLLTKNEVLVRIYILEAWGLMSMDEEGNSDPYIKIKLGKQIINDSENYQEDEANPNFYKYFDLNTTLPGPSQLKIQLWDHDTVFNDELIGQTIIDLEDRFFQPKWQAITHKPIETRALKAKGSDLTTGTISLWVEIFPRKTKTRDIKLWDISERPPAPFDCRLIVWGTEGVECADIEGTSDIFIRAWINNLTPQETDTHFRCTTGCGSFNWRMIFPMKLPQLSYLCTIQIWDRDITSFSDFLAETSFDFADIAEKALQHNSRFQKKGRYGGDKWYNKSIASNDSDKFWVECKKRGKNKELVDGGRILISFELVPEIQAKACLVGLGRNEPNTDPVLPAPTGRIEFSLNPIKMLMQLCGPAFQLQILCALLCVIFLLFGIYFVPLVITNIVSDMLSPF